ncbi:MAG: hypothetical protein IT559_00335 [Alphaproteobacteria bacterium]|nr:hypothetical protein [Alphaproteobacteria bacterium]
MTELKGSNAQLTLAPEERAVVEQGGIKVQFNGSDNVTVLQNGVTVYPLPANGNAPQTQPALANTAAAEDHPVGTLDAPNWQYAGISPTTGKDYWLQIEDAGIMNHFNAVSYAKTNGFRLMSGAEGIQTYKQQDQLQGVFNKEMGYWLEEHGTSNARVQWFDCNIRVNLHRLKDRPVRCVRDDDPRL